MNGLINIAVGLCCLVPYAVLCLWLGYLWNKSESPDLKDDVTLVFMASIVPALLLPFLLGVAYAMGAWVLK